MKRSMMIIAALVVLTAMTAQADRDVITTTVKGGVTNTIGPFNASGWLDKIEISQSASRSCTVVIATYDAAGTAIDTLVSSGVTDADTLVVRPRKVGTSSAGVALSAVSTTTAEYYGTILTVPYEKIMAGGNIKAIVGAAPGSAATDTNTVTIGLFYEPTKK